MSLRDTIKDMRELLSHIVTDLEKAEGGNKAASQRVRTRTVKLEKTAKVYRKQSIESEKQPRARKSSASNAAKKPAPTPIAPAKAAKVKTSTKVPMAAAHAPVATAKIKAKPKAAVARARPMPLDMKRPTAKLPARPATLY